MVTLKNLGASVATNVVITDVFQGGGVTFVGVSGLSSGVSLQGSSANGVTFTLTSLNPLATAVMIYKVNASQVGVITNTASASADQAEVDPTNNSAKVFTLVSHLVINKAVNAASPISGAVAPGGLFTYTLAVSNLGPNAASNITVTDALPTGVRLRERAGVWLDVQRIGVARDLHEANARRRRSAAHPDCGYCAGHGWLGVDQHSHRDLRHLPGDRGF